jgi:hypothetical protein
VARVLAIRDSGEGGHMPYVGDAMVMEQASAPPPVSAAPFRPGMNASEVRVRADFALGPDSGRTESGRSATTLDAGAFYPRSGGTRVEYES